MKFKFAWPFETKPRDPQDTMLIFNAVYAVPGFKELLSNDIYFYKRKFIESDSKEVESLYMAECYQRLLDKMVKSHQTLLAKVKEIEDTKH